MAHAGLVGLVQDEVLVELKQGVAADVVARRHNLMALSTERFTLANVSIVRYRVEGNRSARQALAVLLLISPARDQPEIILRNF